ncbi:MAG: hypothetical protein QNL17_09420, partial [Synechococcus sp. ChSW.bin.154]
SISLENFSITNICPIVKAIESIGLFARQSEVNPEGITSQINQKVIATDLTIACSTHYILHVTDQCLKALIPLIETAN